MSYSPPSNMPPKQPGYADPTGPGSYAVASTAKKSGPSFPIGFSAGGGLVVGIIAGLLLISGGGDTSEAVAAGDDAIDLVATADTDEATPTSEDGNDEPAKADTENADEGEGETGTPVEAVAATDDTAADKTDKPEVGATKPAVEIPVVEAEPEPIVALLTFNISPPDVLSSIRITVDGEPSSVDSASLEFEPKKTSKRVKIEANAEGYLPFKGTYVVKGDKELSIRLRKPAAVDSTPRTTKPKGNKGKGKGKGKGPGGLITL